MFKICFLSLIVVALNLVGCGQFSSGENSSSLANPLARKPFGTCDRKNVDTINLCMEAVGSDYNESGYLSILQSSCESSGGVFSVETCDPTESFGSCVVGMGQTNLTYITYYAPAYTNESAQAACEGIAGAIYFSYSGN